MAKDGFWKETGKKVVKRQRLLVQRWFVRHPMTFGVTYGVVAGGKGLFWTLPSWGIRKATGRPKKVKAPKAADEGLTTTTVTEIVDSHGNVSTSTRTTTVSGEGYRGFAMAPPAQVGATSTAGRPALFVVDPIERTHVMATTEALLQRTQLGQAYLALASEIGGFVPVRGNEANSTVQLVEGIYMGAKRIALSVGFFADTVADMGLHREIINGLHQAVIAAEGLDTAMKQANGQLAAHYEGQISQESSGIATVSATPVPLGAGVDAEGVEPRALFIGMFYERFDPPIDNEATAIFEVIKTSQAGFAMLADSLTVLTQRLRAHGVDMRIRRLFRNASGNALATAEAFGATRKTMARLYKGQMAQEQAGVTTIRTAPMSAAS